MTDKNHQREKVKYIFQRLWLEALIFLLPLGLGVILLILTANTLRVLSCSLSLFTVGFSGVIVIVRKEIPTAFSKIHGTRAVIEGILFVALFWGAALFFLVDGLK